jgi:hypothetical protein
MAENVSNTLQYNVYIKLDLYEPTPWSSLFWEADSHLAIQEIPFFLFNLKVYYLAHNSQLLDTILKDLYFL